MNKKLKGLLALVLVAGTITFGGGYAYADTTVVKDDSQVVTDDLQVKSDEEAAALIDMESLKVSETEAKPGDTVKVSFKAKEKLNMAMVQFRKPISGRLELVHMTYNEETDLYEGKITVTDESESGKWQMTRMIIQKEPGRTGNIFDKNLVVGATNGEDLSAADFNVSGTKITSKEDMDLDAPLVDLSSLTVDNKEVYAGDKVKVSLKAEDKSGIEEIDLNYLTPAGNKERVILEYNEAEDKYEGSIDTNKDYGTWQLEGILAIDKEYNAIFFDKGFYNEQIGGVPDLSAGNFEVKKIVDVTAPTVDFNSISATKTKTNQFHISLKAYDDVSGIKNIKVCYESPSKKSSNVYQLNRNNGSDEYRVDFAFLGETEEGTWKISYIEVTDNDGNEAKYTADQYDLSKGNIEVEKGKPIVIDPDRNPPISIPLNPGSIQLKPGSTQFNPGTIIINPDRIKKDEQGNLIIDSDEMKKAESIKLDEDAILKLKQSQINQLYRKIN